VRQFWRQTLAVVAAIEGHKAPALKVRDMIVQIDPRYCLPVELETFLGDPAKAKAKLGLVLQITLEQMIVEMIANAWIKPNSMPCFISMDITLI